MNEWIDDVKMTEKSYDDGPMKDNDWRNQSMREQWMKEWTDDGTFIK